MNVYNQGNLYRIGIFYDGNYFYHVSNYYNFTHPRKKRINISGLHDFVKQQIAEREGLDARYCQIVDAHYFRGRISAQDAHEKNTLLSERLFDDVLMKEGITTHFLPLSSYGEKGIDVWLSLEAYELSVMKHFNVVVLVVCDGDYLSLVRKINGLGTKVMVLGWDFEYTDAYGRMGRTVTSARLLNEATYPILMHTIIDDKTKYHDPLINNLFVSPENSNEYENSSGSKDEYGGSGIFDDDSQEGIVIALKDGYGFIQCDTRAENIFFYWGDVEDEFNDLEIGDKVSFHFGTNERGICAKHVERIDSL